MSRFAILAFLLIGLVAWADDESIDPAKYKSPDQAKAAEVKPARTPVSARAYLGITPGEQTEEGTGVPLAEVPAEGPAGKAGLQAGDRILQFDGEEVKEFNALRRLIGAKKAGDKVEIVVDRSGEEKRLEVTLGTAPANDGLSGIWKKPGFKLALVLMEFEDVRHNPAFTTADFEAMLFSRGTYTGLNPSGEQVHGSLADYYRENSYGKLAVTGKVFDWVTLDKERAFFEEKRMGDREASKEFFPKALEKLKAREGEECLDGFDGLVFMYSGRQTYLRPRFLWPYRSSMKIGAKNVPYYMTAEGGKYFNAVNVHIHEFGHMLGLPDQYGAKHATGIGKWCTMSVGHMGGGESRVHRPFHLCLWCKERLGWVRVVPVRPSEAQWLKLSAIEKDPGMAFKILLKPDGSDAYLLENRQHVGFDSELEGTGLLIWRSARGSVTLVEAHGKKLPNAALVDPEEIPFPTTAKHDFTPETAPASAGSVYLTDIVEKEGVVYFKLGIEKKVKPVELEKRKDY